MFLRIRCHCEQLISYVSSHHAMSPPRQMNLREPENQQTRQTQRLAAASPQWSY